jgi:hypothetical protein
MRRMIPVKKEFFHGYLCSDCGWNPPPIPEQQLLAATDQDERLTSRNINNALMPILDLASRYDEMWCCEGYLMI